MAQEQLHEAHELIEQGRIGEARRLLETMDDPTAHLWLTQLTTARRVRRQSLSRAVPLPLLVAIAIVIGIGALVVILVLTPTLIQRMQERSQQNQSQLSSDVQIQAQLADFCRAALGASAGNRCAVWTQSVMATQRATAVTCLNSFGGPTPELRIKLATCLTNAGISIPT